MSKLGLKISDRGVLTLSKAAWESIGNATSVSITADRRYGSICIRPEGDRAVYSRKDRVSPQISLGAALRELGIGKVIPGRREIGRIDGTLMVWPTRIIEEE